MWCDSHAHIDGLDAREQAAVVARAREAGVRWIINAADSVESCRRVRDLAARFDAVWGTAGVHPHNAKDVTDATYPLIEEALADEKIVAVGEIGLDYYYQHSDRAVQIEVFERMMDVALRAGKPVVVHHRESAEQTVCSMQKFCARGLRGVLHCFSGSWDFARQLLDMGLWVSFSGILTFRNAQPLRDVAAKIPLDRVLLETDSPYLAPEPVRGSANEPKNLVYVAQCFAQLRSVRLEELSEQTLKNTSRLFGLDLKGAVS